MDRTSTSMIPLPSTGLKKLGAMVNPSRTLRSTLVSASASRLSKPAAQISPAPAGSKPREEIYAPGYLTDVKVRHQIMCALNPDIDTTPAILGHKDPSKLQINLYHPPFGKAGKPLSLAYCEVKWDSHSEIRSLNRWRQTAFAHYLGPEFQGKGHMEKTIVAETSEVPEYLADGNVRPKRKMPRIPGGADSWAKVTQAFDMRFSNNQQLSGCNDMRATKTQVDNVSCQVETKRNSTSSSSPVSQDGGRQRTSIPSPVSQALSRRLSTSASPTSETRPRALTKPKAGSSGIPKLVHSRTWTN